MEVEGDRLWTAPACTAAQEQIQPGLPVRVESDNQYHTFASCRACSALAARHVLDAATFDDCEKAVMPTSDMFRHERCEPIIRL